MRSIETAVAQISQWMRKHGAEAIVSNLASGAAEEDLEQAEARLGFRLPAGLRELWSLHDGQDAEQDGFYEMYDLLSSAQADNESFTEFVLYSSNSPRALAESGLSAAEVGSRAWLRICARDSDGVAVNAESGRVFRIAHDDSPCLHLLASSVEAWLDAYAEAVCNDDYRVEEGFGEAYLARRDRAREARDEAALRAQQAEEARRAGSSSLALMEEAVRAKSEAKAQDALKRGGAAAREQLLAALFRGEPAFIASVLRSDLRALTLSREQWQLIASGGEALGNRAIAAYALKMAGAGG